MKKIVIIIVGALSFVSMVQADFSLPAWQYEKEIVNVNKGLAKVTLDNDIFANAGRSLADVRVVDDTNQEIPYKLIALKNEEGRKDYYPKMLNNSVTKENASMVILDLGQRGVITNSITIKTSSENFQRNVNIYGSNEQDNWNLLTSGGYIYDFTDKKANVKAQNSTVIFPDSTFEFLKVEIAADNGVPVTINSISVSENIKKSAQEFSLTPKFEVTQDVTTKTSVLLIDMGQGGIPVNKISLLVDGDNFNRGASVYASNDKNTTNWKSVGQGYIFRYNTPKFAGENTTLNINETVEKYFKIVVYNNDNSPLNFTGIRAWATYRDLVFQADTQKSYRLFYGNPKAQKPQYDLEKYFQYLDLANTQKVALGLQKQNSQFAPEKQPEKPLSERIPYLLPMALATAAMILLLMVYRFLKKT